MILGTRNHFLNHLCNRYSFYVSSVPLQSFANYANSSPFSKIYLLNPFRKKTANLDLFSHTHFSIDSKITSICSQLPFCSLYQNGFPRNFSSRPYVRRKKRNKPKTIKDFPEKVVEFERCVAQLPPRFIPEDLYNILIMLDDPLVCFELFNYASQQPRFRHDVSTYHLTIKKLGTAQMYDEMECVINQVLAVPRIGSEALFNTIIYFYTEARQLTKAVNVYKHMRRSSDESCRPSVRTYNLLFTSFLSKRNNSYINHMYMETIRCLFKQMVNDGVEPDIFSLNSMIKGYILSLHVNDALRIFHQMGVVYRCHPDSHSYNYLIHGLCCQGRTNNAKGLYTEMRGKGFVPSGKAYNSLVSSLAIGGEIEEAVRLLWEMNEERRSADFITYRTVLDEICRQGKVREAKRLLEEFEEKDLVDGLTGKKLLHVIEFGDSNVK